jgi:branched-chain amino acid transport system substrate-binding protein
VTTPQSHLQYPVCKKLGLKKIAELHDNDDYGKVLAECQPTGERRRHRGVLFEGITPGAMDYSAVIQRSGRRRPARGVRGYIPRLQAGHGASQE